MEVMIDGKKFEEAKRDRNSGNRNSGNSNSGNWNSGNSNSGDRNSGNWNSGYSNSGDWNSGDRNSGYSNSGNSNSGDRNSGDWNSGDSNSGDRNSGNCNSGYSNSGYSNSGDRNSGDWNSGDWNSGDRNSGYLNSNRPFLRFFNKETKLLNADKIKFPEYFYFDLTEWIEVKSMTDEEKAKYPHYAVTTGFLRVHDYKQAWKISFDKATKEDVALTLKLPNFDYKIFAEVSGITKKDFDKKLKE